MNKHFKLLSRFLVRPKDFSWSELVTLLNHFDYELVSGGKTGGSRMRFIHHELPPIILHKPHPSPLLKRYQIEDILNVLREGGLI